MSKAQVGLSFRVSVEVFDKLGDKPNQAARRLVEQAILGRAIEDLAVPQKFYGNPEVKGEFPLATLVVDMPVCVPSTASTQAPKPLGKIAAAKEAMRAKLAAKAALAHPEVPGDLAVDYDDLENA